MQTVFIYALKCPTADRIMYVGKANDVAKRYKSHIRDSHTRDTPLYRWIRQLAASGLKPIVTTLEQTSQFDWTERETALIAHYRSLGNLLNVADGGNEPKCDYETRAANGRRVAKLREAYGPRQRRLYVLKREIGQIYNRLKRFGKPEHSARLRECLLFLASRHPQMFGCWSNL